MLQQLLVSIVALLLTGLLASDAIAKDKSSIDLCQIASLMPGQNPSGEFSEHSLYWDAPAHSRSQLIKSSSKVAGWKSDRLIPANTPICLAPPQRPLYVQIRPGMLDKAFVPFNDTERLMTTLPKNKLRVLNSEAIVFYEVSSKGGKDIDYWYDTNASLRKIGVGAYRQAVLDLYGETDWQTFVGKHANDAFYRIPFPSPVFVEADASWLQAVGSGNNVYQIAAPTTRVAQKSVVVVAEGGSTPRAPDASELNTSERIQKLQQEIDVLNRERNSVVAQRVNADGQLKKMLAELSGVRKELAQERRGKSILENDLSNVRTQLENLLKTQLTDMRTQIDELLYNRGLMQQQITQLLILTVVSAIAIVFILLWLLFWRKSSRSEPEVLQEFEARHPEMTQEPQHESWNSKEEVLGAIQHGLCEPYMRMNTFATFLKDGDPRERVLEEIKLQLQGIHERLNALKDEEVVWEPEVVR